MQQRGQRFYSPGLGRWANRDPIGESGGDNLFGFIFNDPVSDFDPFGQLSYRTSISRGQCGVYTVAIKYGEGSSTGWVIQKIMRTYELFKSGSARFPDCCCEDVSARTDEEFFEIMPVCGGTIEDDHSTEGWSDCVKIKKTVARDAAFISGHYRGKDPCDGSGRPTRECPPGWYERGEYKCRYDGRGTPPGFSGGSVSLTITAEWDCCESAQYTSVQVTR